MTGRMLRGILILVALAVALGPFVVLIVNSIRPPDEFLSASAGFLPSHVTFEYYAAIFDPDESTIRYLINSLIVTTATTVIAVAVGALAAYALARLKLPFRLSLVIGLAFLIVRFYPKITVALPYYLMMRDLGLLDTHVAVILAHVSITVAADLVVDPLQGQHLFLERLQRLENAFELKLLALALRPEFPRNGAVGREHDDEALLLLSIGSGGHESGQTGEERQRSGRYAEIPEEMAAIDV